MPRILIVEDDDAIAEPLVAGLSREQYDVTHVATAAAMWDHVADADLVLLDLGLPDQDGLELCRELRARGSDIPLMVLTGRAEESDMVAGLDAGADDYVVKPFRRPELFARIRALLRRRTGTTTLAAGDVTIDLASQHVWVAGKPAPLTRTELAILVQLVRDAGKVVPRTQLLDEIWGGPWAGADQTVDVHLSALRRKLNAAGGAGSRITTVRGQGYRFER